MDATDEKVLERLIEACVTGKPCKTSETGPRRVEALSCRGLGILSGRKLWPEAMRRVAALGTAHPDAQARFLATWAKVSWHPLRKRTANDDLWFAALRVLLPPYEGGPMKLYRGQLDDHTVGASWTCNYRVARKFAFFGTANVNPFFLEGEEPRGYRPRMNSVILVATAHFEIICARPQEGEFIVDPRSLSITTPWKIASAWPREEPAQPH